MDHVIESEQNEEMDMDDTLHDHSTVEGIVRHVDDIVARIGTTRSARHLGRTKGGYPTIEILDPRSGDEPIASVLATEVRTMIQEGSFGTWITDLPQNDGEEPAGAILTVRHDLDPAVVSDTIARAIEKKAEYGETMRTSNDTQRTAYEAAVAEGREWTRHLPMTEAEVDAFIEARAAEERDVYGKVRIIEMVGENRPKDRFFLVYGEQPDDLSGRKTGGFASLDIAREWFTNQGR
jgi:hypothetical protein